MKVVFVDTVHHALEERLLASGFACVPAYTLRKEEIITQHNDAEGLVIRSRFKIDKDFLNAMSKLRFIARSGAGMENIDVSYAQSKCIRCYNSPEGNRDAVAEHAMGMLLSLFNKLGKADAEVKMGIWEREANRGIELCGKTVSIIGYGYMGAAFAQRLQGFGCRVLAHDKYKKGFGNSLVTEAELEQVFAESDIVSLHLPLSSETAHYVNKTFIQSFAKPFYLINTARGKHVCTHDLVTALQEKKILGACLDVLEYEKTSFENLDTKSLPDDSRFLITHPAVLLSPHIAGWTVESHEKLSVFLAQKILADFA